MKKVYYLDRIKFDNKDTHVAFEKALEILKNDASITTITFLVYQQQHISPFLSSLGLSSQQIKNKGFKAGKYSVQIHTVKTYHPKNVFAGHQASEMLMAVCMPPEHFNKFIDYSNIKYWVIVPWLLEEVLPWLRVHEAENIETGISLTMDTVLDPKVIDAIEWLKSTSFPNEGMNHPNDSDRLKSVSNELRRNNISFDKDSVIHYCINNGILETYARKIADAFARAQTRAFSASNCYTINK